ncbi:MAG: hypothetical protein KDD56_02365 [Bdellovibrionales bacterium]|nr:hypothetical protein [Bdellovibrionales bacterium]
METHAAISQAPVTNAELKDSTCIQAIRTSLEQIMSQRPFCLIKELDRGIKTVTLKSSEGTAQFTQYKQSWHNFPSAQISLENLEKTPIELTGHEARELMMQINQIICESKKKTIKLVNRLLVDRKLQEKVLPYWRIKMDGVNKISLSLKIYGLVLRVEKDRTDGQVSFKAKILLNETESPEHTFGTHTSAMLFQIVSSNLILQRRNRLL